MPFITRTHSRVALVAIAVLAVAGVSSGIAQNSLSDQATAAGGNLICDQNTLYGIVGSTREVIQIDATTGATTSVATLPVATNALAITRDGAKLWAFENGGNGTRIDVYDPNLGTTSTITAESSSQQAIRGAVNPVNNLFYYASGGSSSRIAAYDTDNGIAIGQIGTITGLGSGSGNNGDMAFGSDGTLYVVDADTVYRVGTVPTVAGTGNLAATAIATLPSGTNSPGIAYSSDGYLYLARGASGEIYKINPSSGALVTTVTTSTSQDVVDLATCNYANSLRGQTDVRSRAGSGDQFVITNSGNGISSGNTATTTGNGTGIQGVAGPNLTVGGANYTVTQTASGTTNLANYSVGWTCTNRTTNTTVASGSGNTASFTNPTTPTSTNAMGTDVVCTFVTAVLPKANNDSYATPINTTLTVNAAGGVLVNDTGSSITVTNGTPASHGTATATGNAGAFSYTPTNGFTGTDSFGYTITDVNGATSTATVTIQVNPVAVNDSYSTPADTPLTISDLTANDTPTTMTVQSVTTPSHGTAVLNSDGTVTYTPTAGNTVPDSFSYTAVDGNGQTATATVSITIASAGVDDSVTSSTTGTTVIRPLDNDTPSAGSTFDPATLRIFDPSTSTWVTQLTVPSVGTWKVVGSEIQFTPVTGYAGTTSVQYRATDTAGKTWTAKASVSQLPTIALAYTNVDRAGLGVWGAGIGGLLLGLTLLIFSKFQRYHRPKRRPRHSAAMA